MCKKGSIINPIKEPPLLITPPNLSKINQRIVSNGKKYHLSIMCAGVFNGFSEIELSDNQYKKHTTSIHNVNIINKANKSLT